MTNGDKWRAMSDEQIAELIFKHQEEDCPCCAKTKSCEMFENEQTCKAEIVRWLKEEEEEND